jgi:hypothetical protein
MASMTDADKVVSYDKIDAIINNHLSVMKQQKKDGASFNEIESAKVAAYRKIVQIVTGKDPL